jgi:hypothetical protein
MPARPFLLAYWVTLKFPAMNVTHFRSVTCYENHKRLKVSGKTVAKRRCRECGAMEGQNVTKGSIHSEEQSWAMLSPI